MGKYQLPVLLVAPGASCPGGWLAVLPAWSPWLEWMGRSLSGGRVTLQTGGEVGLVGPLLLLQEM